RPLSMTAAAWTFRSPASFRNSRGSPSSCRCAVLSRCKSPKGTLRFAQGQAPALQRNSSIVETWRPIGTRLGIHHHYIPTQRERTSQCSRVMRLELGLVSAFGGSGGLGGWGRRGGRGRALGNHVDGAVGGGKPDRRGALAITARERRRFTLLRY